MLRIPPFVRKTLVPITRQLRCGDLVEVRKGSPGHESWLFATVLVLPDACGAIGIEHAGGVRETVPRTHWR